MEVMLVSGIDVGSVWVSVLLVANHRVIGSIYTAVACCVGVCAFSASVMTRLDLNAVGCGVLLGDYQFYNVLTTCHGLLMIFGFMMPLLLGGFANVTLPVLLCVPDMLYARLNGISLWLFVLGVLMMACGVLVEEGCGVG